MHELTLMQSVLQTVEQDAAQHGINRINKVKLVIGQLTMALPDSLIFAFEALKPGTMFSDASLIIEERHAQCTCHSCQQEYKLDDYFQFVCPTCGSTDIEVEGGKELYIDYYEGD
ncbi:MAG TPA: hydrogenase maturation nickel metallochaperone HypA [Syntrophomonadaceae bacterium]|jgi:hydrogenase nickel incorporation protein HypA/HybF|nr:hydrogenase maturation nickel metallochaperone HypA [Syntrophomonadaceae bacterium]HOQ09957.1 hydrogenase maturation nickel metallochaperone HypA [Syntrophomonadaceae bacterium]HPU49423.1 hydrogenase maturation nickel metallochaperone HypA [Syntrophomonadaceae bacterium]